MKLKLSFLAITCFLSTNLAYGQITPCPDAINLHVDMSVTNENSLTNMVSGVSEFLTTQCQSGDFQSVRNNSSAYIDIESNTVKIRVNLIGLNNGCRPEGNIQDLLREKIGDNTVSARFSRNCN